MLHQREPACDLVWRREISNREFWSDLNVILCFNMCLFHIKVDRLLSKSFFLNFRHFLDAMLNTFLKYSLKSLFTYWIDFKGNFPIFHNNYRPTFATWSAQFKCVTCCKISKYVWCLFCSDCDFLRFLFKMQIEWRKGEDEGRGWRSGKA